MTEIAVRTPRHFIEAWVEENNLPYSKEAVTYLECLLREDIYKKKKAGILLKDIPIENLRPDYISGLLRQLYKEVPDMDDLAKLVAKDNELACKTSV